MNSVDIVDHYQHAGIDETVTVEDVALSVRRFEPDGDAEATLVTISGGPGVPGAFLAPIATLSEFGYRVICYDQHNVGASENHPRPYNIETFKQELDAFVEQYETPVLVGHSWGAMLALDYVCDASRNDVSGLTCIAPLFDTEMNTTIARTRRAETLDEESLRRVTELEAHGTYDDEYEALEETVYATHMYNTEKPYFVEEQYERFNEEMYEHMWGPAEYELRDGATLEDWSVWDELEGVDTPTMLVTGEDDLFGVHDLLEAEQRMQNASAELIADASHAPLWETPSVFHDTLRSWLQYTTF